MTDVPTDIHLTTSVGHRPSDRWQFDDAVTDVFDDMLARLDAPDLLHGRNGQRAGPSGFAADINEVGAALEEDGRMPNRGLRN